MPETQAMGSTSQVVSVLVSTMTSSTTTTIFADNFFTSLWLVRYLKDKNCRFAGTARDNRIGKPPLKPIKVMEKKAVPRGAWDYVTSDDGILALGWKDNKVITLLSTDLGVEPASSVSWYCRDTKRKEEVCCPAVIKSYNANMGGIDKSDMLVHLCRTPVKSKRWYMRMFAYAIDISLTNAWLIYWLDCKALGDENGMPLKDFRIKVFRDASAQKMVTSRPLRDSTSSNISTFVDLSPVRGHRSHITNNSDRFDQSLTMLLSTPRGRHANTAARRVISWGQTLRAVSARSTYTEKFF